MDDLFNILIPFDTNGDGYTRYDLEGCCISDVVEQWLQFNNIEQYSVEEVQAFESCGYESSVLCVAWVAKNGRLNTCNLLVEVR